MDRRNGIALAVTAVSTAILLGAAVSNGYPLILSDTGAYLWSGWMLRVPPDRPILYGLFLRGTALGVTLWMPIVVQALLTVGTVRFTLGRSVPAWITLAIIGFLGLTTGLAPIAGLLIPDLFASLAVLTLAGLLAAPNLTRGQWLGAGAVLVLSLVVHMSHLLISAMLTLAAVAFTAAAPAAAARAGLTRGRSLRLAALVAASALLVPTVHSLFGGGFVWTRYSHVFTMGRMAENGVLRAFLDEACPSRSYRLCDYRSMFPMSASRFLWEQDSPFVLTGEAEANRAEYEEIIGATLRQRRFLAMQVGKGLEGAAQQLVRFNVPSFRRFGPGSPPYQSILRFLPNDLPRYQRARQMERLSFGWINAVQPWGLLLSLIAIVAALSIPALRRRVPGFRIGWAFAILAGVVANAAVCGALSSPVNRYGARVVWIIPLTAITLFAMMRYGSGEEARTSPS